MDIAIFRKYSTAPMLYVCFICRICVCVCVCVIVMAVSPVSTLMNGSLWLDCTMLQTERGRVKWR